MAEDGPAFLGWGAQVKTQRYIARYTALVAILVALSPCVAHPCTIEVHSPKWLLHHSRIVLTGKLTEIRSTDPQERWEASDYKLVFHVERYWKGVKTPDIVLQTNDLGLGCPPTLKVGREYLIYAYENGEINRLSRTLEFAEKDLQEIGPGKEFKEK